MSDAPVTPIRPASLPLMQPLASAGIPAAVLHEPTVRAVLWQYGLAGQREPGHGDAALMTAFQRADEDRFEKLRSIEPVFGYWMHAMRFGDTGHHLALRALALIESVR